MYGQRPRLPFLSNLTRHAVDKSDKQDRFIPEVAKVSVPPSWAEKEMQEIYAGRKRRP